MAGDKFNIDGVTEKVSHPYDPSTKLDMTVTRSNGKPSQFVSILQLPNGDQTTTMVGDNGTITVQDVRNGRVRTTEIKNTKIAGDILKEWDKAARNGTLESTEFAALEGKLNVANAAVEKQQQMESALAKSGICKTDLCKPMMVADASTNGRPIGQRAPGHGQGVDGRQ